MQARESSSDSPPINLQAIRADFPIVSKSAQGKPLIYLDNAATTQKPRKVIDRIVRYYESENANIHRGVYELSQKATNAYEEARHTVARFINAAADSQVIFTRGTTESINLVASSLSKKYLKAGDEILVSALEHHSNIVPWQLAAEATGARLTVIPMTDAGELQLDQLDSLLTPKTKIVAVNHVSNALGTINDIDRIISAAHRVGARVLIDGAQWVAHGPTDVQKLDADFYCFSGHKLYGPTGIGVLYGKRDILEEMPPFQGGGDMIESVTFAKTTYAGLPNKFEAGTPDISGAIGLAAAIEYVEAIGFDKIAAHEHALLDAATHRLSEIAGVRILGTASRKAGVISFVVDEPAMSALDVGLKLDQLGIAVRTGHHCCQPIMNRLGVPATARASFAVYNTLEEVEAFAAGLEQIVADKRGAATSSRAAASDKNATIEYPRASAPSPSEAADELAENFELLEERDAKNEYVLDLGDKLPHTFELLKKVTPRVQGCMSEVYLVSRRSPGDTEAMEFVADANADIVRGLIAVLQRIFSGQKAADILAFDIEPFFRRIGLDQFITTQRRNGLAGMLARIRAAASAVANRGTADVG